MQHSRLLVGLVLSFGLILAGCSSTAPSEQSSTDSVSLPTIESAQNDTPEQVVGTRVFELESFMFGYSEDVIRVEAGETVTIRLGNTGGLHDFVIDELGVATAQIAVGETDTVTFTVPEDAAGTSYEFYCSVMDHRARGMVGMLEVVESGTL
jgi:plastocyanin